ncbi:MAG: PD-(D/E)XK nuclease-like domain-containing protein [Gemmatimonadota bacterium]
MSELSDDFPWTPGGFPEEPDEPTPDLDAPRIIDPRTLPARFHNLRAAGLSGAHALLSFQGDSPDSLARRLGTGTHAMLTGKPWVPWNQPSKASVDRRAKVMKEVRAGAKKPLPPLTIAPRSGEEWKAFCVANQGKAILTQSEADKARRMVDAIMLHPIANRLLTGDVIFERSIVWSQNGRARQSTPDARRADGEHNTEIKTTRSAHPIWFLRDAEKYCYHGQLADQAAAIKHETGHAPRHSYIIAVESAPPHIVQVFEALPATLDKGAQLCEIWLDKLQVFEATGMWGGYSDRIEPWELVQATDAPVADPDWMSDDKQGDQST